MSSIPQLSLPFTTRGVETIRKNCPICARPFYPPKVQADRHVYCSRFCHNISISRRPKNLLALECKICHNPFEVSYKQRNRQYCSRECTYARQIPSALIDKPCLNCEQTFKVKPSHYDKRFYCSMSCVSEHYKTRMTGEANPNYRNAGQKTCLRCGVSFVAYSPTRKYCSHVCYGLSQRKPRKPRSPRPQKLTSITVRKKQAQTFSSHERTCRKCGSTFVSEHAFYCSASCRFAYRTPAPRPCLVCGSLIALSKTMHRKTCSHSCQQRWRSLNQQGQKSHRWQGGKTTQVMIFRGSLDYSLWRKSVYLRDDFTCQMCRQKGGRLCAHHIKRFALHEDLRLDVSNGISLCWPCHASIRHKEEQYEAQFFAITKP